MLLVESCTTPAALLRLLKRIERRAGRRQRGLNAARPLDLDLVDAGGRRIGWPAARARLDTPASRSYRPGSGPRRQARGWLTLPHPEMHRRRFVLEPLAEIAPHWHHPVFRLPVSRLLARLPRPPGQVRRTLDSRWLSCDTEG